RVLSEDIIAEIDVPHFKRSAMDGFAVIAEDTFNTSDVNPKELEIIDSIHCGEISKKKVTHGKCIEITTGAKIPDDANAVLMVEYTEKEKNKIKIYRSLAPGENIITIGSDIKKGTRIFKKGTLLNPRYTGVLSALGISKIKVKRRPIISVLSTGNEILNPGEKLTDGRVYDVNSRTIIDSLKDRNCIVINLGIVRDDENEIKGKIINGIKNSDLIILSGGSSLGSEDMVEKIISKLGKLLVHGIAVKPGKPTIIGKVNNKLVIGLPGNPTSALSNYYILIKPVLDRMLGIRERRKTIKAKLTRKVASTIGRYEFLPVKIVKDNAEPVMKGSNAITTLANADGFVEISENTEVLEKGSTVDVRLL
ncbi:MAG TPA: hypothetical protein EYP86_01585, partial [Candidatus Altiarchaeales archaeon]|nr:hypothetical protein [Candidatus Altiarchaeales archaeon]